MRRRILFTSGVVAALAGLMAATAAPASAATASPANGATMFLGGIQDGFENPAAPPGGFALYDAGQQVGAWKVTSGDVHLIGPGFWQAAEGSQSLDLDGSTPGAVAMDFDTVPLFTYKVSYSLAGNPDSGPAVKTGRVLINGNVVQTFSFDITGKTRVDMGYVRRSFVFLATTPSSTVEFESTTSPGGYGPVLDDVVVGGCLLILCP